MKAIKIPKTILNWYIAVNRPRYLEAAISEMYTGAATDEAPTPKPPMNRKNENIYGSGARAEPTAEMKYRIPIQNNVFFRPKKSQGIPPKTEPITVPQRAIDMINVPWNQGEVFHNSLIGRLAPLMTTVSNPNKKPAKAAVIEIPNIFLSIDERVWVKLLKMT